MKQIDSSPRLKRMTVRGVAGASVLLVLLLATAVPGTAQQLDTANLATAPSIKTPETVSRPAPEDDRYRIGPGDVIEVRIFNRPQLSRDAVRVDARGMIRMPLIEKEIQAACLTEGEVASVIATSYLKYQRNPQVDVFVKDYQSQPVAIIGAVNKPGQFQLQRRVRLLELLSLADGPSTSAGRTIQLVRATAALRCEPAGAANPREDLAEGMVAYNLKDTLEGKDAANPYLWPGDIINIAEAEQAFVIGNVLKPTAIALKEPLTVSKAIAMAGGTLPNTKKDKIRIIRQSPGNTSRQEIFVDLGAINKLQVRDVMLEPGDIVEVQTVTGIQSVLKGMLQTLIPTLTQYPTRVLR